jgi:ABC-2 type transport system permease protein
MAIEIFVREIQDGLASRRFLSIFLLCCTLIPLSVIVNQQTVAAATAEVERARSEYELSLVGIASTDILEVKAFRFPPPLAGLAAGLDGELPTVATLDREGLTLGRGQGVDNPVRSLFGAIDLLFIVKFVLSLVAIALSYDLISGEKELGTLRLILSHPVPRDSLLVGKILAAAVTLLLPFAVAALLSLLLLQLGGGQALSTGRTWAEAILILLISALYLCAFVNLGALVSCLTRRSVSSMMVLLAIWAAWVAVIPQASGLLAEVISPAESTESFQLRKKLLQQDIDRQRGVAMRPYFGREDYAELREPIAARFDEELRRLETRMEETFENQRRAQSRTALALASLSPAASLSFATTGLTGTGPETAVRFRRGLNDFQAALDRDLFAGTFVDRATPGEGSGGRAVGGFGIAKVVDLATLPRFEFQPPPLAEVVATLWPQVLMLLAFNGLFFALAYWRFRRYDVR